MQTAHVRFPRHGFLVACLALGSPTSAQTFVEKVGAVPSGIPNNASSSENVDFADVDLDGDWDAAFADGGDSGNDQNRLWINIGGLQTGPIGSFVDQTSVRFPVLQDDSRDVEFADFDNDGDQDLHVVNTAQIVNQGNRWWTNLGGRQGGTPGFYQDETQARWVGLDSPNSSISLTLLLMNDDGPITFIDWSCDADFGDIDNDGDMDLVQSSYGGSFGGTVPTRMFLNDGDGYFEEFNPSGFKLTSSVLAPGSPGLWCSGVYTPNTVEADGSECDIATAALDIDFGDHDGDFDLDLLHGELSGLPRMFTNQLEESGSLGFHDTTRSSFPLAHASSFGNYEQEWDDLDGDGDLDIHGLNWDGFSDVLFEGNGDGTFGNKTALPSSNQDANEGDFLDYDSDGDMDLIIANFSGANRLYRNNTPGGGLDFVDVTDTEIVQTQNAITLDIDAIDLDADGDTDYMTANDNHAANRLFDNVSQLPDVTPASIQNVEAVPGGAASTGADVVRAQVYDNSAYYVTWFNATRLRVSVNGVDLPPFEMRASGGQVFRGEIPANLVGTVEYVVESTDQVGNVGSSAALSYVNTGPVGASGGGSSPSSLGSAPALVSLASPFAGEPLYLLGENVAAGSLGVFLVSLGTLPALDLGDGIVLNVGAALVPPLVGVADGLGRSLLAIGSVSPSASGATIHVQYIAADGEAGSTWASSQRLSLSFP